MSVKPEIELTADGSHTLFVPELNEHYHSVNGAVQESTHIFINTGLHRCSKNDINIFEIGFGTGLNAFLTLLDLKDKPLKVNYITIEKYPLSQDLIQQLNYAEQTGRDSDKGLYNLLHLAVWEKTCRISSNFTLRKLEGDFTTFDFDTIKDIDLIYFDAFAPDKQADMWTQELFDKLYSICNQGAILVTYCAKGIVRRMMQQSGFKVERLPGPPGKREMLRATK